MTGGLFAEFDASQVAAIEAAYVAERVQDGAARAQRAQHRHLTRRANAEAQLADILPARFQAGESWHVISRGDIDSLSYLRHILAGVSHLDSVLVSTWCIARADLDDIAGWIDSGRIEQFALYAGEIFPSQYGDEHEQMLQMCRDYEGCKLVIARNHSKVMLTSNAADNYHVVIESSANVNTNPRIEQSAIHCDADLHAFYLEFFGGIRSIDRRA